MTRDEYYMKLWYAKQWSPQVSVQKAHANPEAPAAPWRLQIPPPALRSASK